MYQTSTNPFMLTSDRNGITGQTDDFDRHQRQRWFQEVFIGDEGNTKLVNGVDLLSVTTTMEAGVDIGGLEAVMMANMPPRRFNYQQRVGRAGRRGAGVSLAVTFCRGRSHDDYYYQLPEEITGSPPPPPYVDVGSEAILRRVFVKELLRTAFERMELAEDRMFRDSVHGEFGPVADWHLRLQTLREWVDSAESTVAARMILDSLRVGTKWAGNDGELFCEKMVSYAKSGMLEEISEAVYSAVNPQEPLSECLAHAGLLPMFGFPTNVRQLFTQRRYPTNPWPPVVGTIDRDLEMAISQFAPGSQIVKDKAVHTSFGVATIFPWQRGLRAGDGFDPPIGESNTRLLGLCKSCKSVQYVQDRIGEVKSRCVVWEFVNPYVQLSRGRLRDLSLRQRFVVSR